MSKTKRHMENKFGDLEREYLFNDILAQDDSRNYEEFKNSINYEESDIVKKAKIILKNGREINSKKFIFDTTDSRS